MGLGLRFNIILAACYVVGLGLSLWPFYQLSRNEAIEQLQSQIDVLRAEALSVRKYTSDEIRPLLDDQSAIQFLPQTIPSFSAQTVFRNFRSMYPLYSYKEAALNPTNPTDLAKDWEKEIIEKLSRKSANRQGHRHPHHRRGAAIYRDLSNGHQGRKLSVLPLHS